MDERVNSDSNVPFRQLHDVTRSAETGRLPVDSCPHHKDNICGDCRLETLCLPAGLSPKELDRLDAVIQRGRPLRPGEHLYRQDAPFKSVFAIRSGSVKIYHLAEDGSEQVAGFHFPGEVVGTDGISGKRHHNSAEALETASICEIPFERLEELSSTMPDLQRRFFQLLSQEIIGEQKLMALLGGSDADQRMVSFLLNLSARNGERRLSERRFRLPMSRGDIGNYLGLRVETVSRVLSRLQQKQLLSIEGREVTLLEFEHLRAMLRDG